jgi:uncharacterized protein (DUF2345 family)
MSSNEMTLASGYVLDATTAGDELRLHAPDGRVCLKIKLTAEGPEVELSSVALSIAAKGDVNVACERFNVAASQGVSLTTSGELVAKAEGAIELEGRSQKLRATRGEISVYANDDVAIDGERIRLNSPMPLPRLGRVR